MALTNLPPELLLQIMEHIHTPFALRSLALSCHSLYDIIFEHEHNLCSQALTNYIPEHILRDISIAWRVHQCLDCKSGHARWTRDEQRRVFASDTCASVKVLAEDCTMLRAIGPSIHESKFY